MFRYTATSEIHLRGFISVYTVLHGTTRRRTEHMRVTIAPFVIALTFSIALTQRCRREASSRFSSCLAIIPSPICRIWRVACPARP